MVQYKCRTCGGEMEFGGSGGFVCPYCGSKSFMTDADFKGNEEFRKKLLEYYKAQADNKEFDYSSDTLWKCNGEDNFVMKNGQNLSVKYMYKYDYNGCVSYVAKENAVYVFDNDKSKSDFMNGLQRLVFPEADVKLERCFPKLKMEIELSDGREVLVYIRRPNFFPAELFAPVASEHLAWMISRMENICCELKYSNIQHGGIDERSLWVNPITHEGALFGDWRNVCSKKTNFDLQLVRETAQKVMHGDNSPKQSIEFLH